MTHLFKLLNKLLDEGIRRELKEGHEELVDDIEELSKMYCNEQK